MNFILSLFSIRDSNVREFLEKGAVIVDVRTEQEFFSGHIANSVNIPIDKLSSEIDTLKKYDAIVLCCRSGARSALAKDLLVKNGVTNVRNAGSWTNLRDLLNP